MNFHKLLEQYNYEFPKNLIAQKPASPRDSAKLLVYNRQSQTINHDRFANIIKYLPKNAVLVLNQTKVVPARLTVTKETGGKASLLYIDHDDEYVRVLSDHKLHSNTALYRSGRILFTVMEQEDSSYILKPMFPIGKIYHILEEFGQTPLPPYIKNSPLTGKKLRSEYQSVFAKHRGSVAAPTASLHFTKRLLNKIKKAGIDIEFVTLHVNLGTFASLTEQQIKIGKLHSEYYEIDSETAKRLNKAKKQGRPIVAVGTTVVRTLESAAHAGGRVSKLSGNTQLFIQAGYTFKFIDSLITNFHVPKSSLLMLVAAFIGRQKLLALYQAAIAKKYKLFSFGDGMLIC